MNFYTSDEHYNHFNVIRFCNRPFRDSAHMNEVLIQRHNSRVKPADTVYHLGDFKISNDGPNKHELIQRLNGHHVFIRGNHDKRNGCNTALTYAVIETYNQRVLLTHRDIDAEAFMLSGGIYMAFVGHSHDSWKFKHGMVNVGVDVWDYYPVDAKQIFKAYNGWLKSNC